jgi:FAD/FMN-containing dehydrogenase
LTLPDHHAAALSSLLGPAGFLISPSNLAAYEKGWRYGDGKAAAVLRPANTAEVSDSVRYCVRNGLHIIPQGGNTGLVDASTPDASGTQLVLSTERLRAPLDLNLANRTVTVGAGVRLSQLNGMLAPHGLELPIDLGADPMIGGMIATNTGGARFLRHKGMREQVLGLEAVLADSAGTVFDGMNCLRKNNVGFEAKQIFIGTSGIFGIITKAVLEVHYRPAETVTALIVPKIPDSALTIIEHIERLAGETLSAVEGMSGSSMTHAFENVPSLRNPFQDHAVPEYAILVELSRSTIPPPNETPLQAIAERVLSDVWDAGAGTINDVLFDGSGQFWALRHALSEGLRHAGDVIALDVSVQRSDLFKLRLFVSEWLRNAHPQLTLCDFGHVCDGSVHLNIVAPRDWSSGKFDIRQTLRSDLLEQLVRIFGASYSAEHGLGRVNKQQHAAFGDPFSRRITDAIKTACAPGLVGLQR